MSVIRLAITAASIAVTVARHPAVRAGIRAAPYLITPAMRERASEAALETAYRAGTIARRVVSKRLVE